MKDIKDLDKDQRFGGTYLTASGPFVVYLWAKQHLDGTFDWEIFNSFISSMNYALENEDDIPCEIANGKAGMVAGLLMIKDLNHSQEMHQIFLEMSIKIKF